MVVILVRSCALIFALVFRRRGRHHVPGLFEVGECSRGLVYDDASSAGGGKASETGMFGSERSKPCACFRPDPRGLGVLVSCRFSLCVPPPSPHSLPIPYSRGINHGAYRGTNESMVVARYLEAFLFVFGSVFSTLPVKYGPARCPPKSLLRTTAPNICKGSFYTLLAVVRAVSIVSKISKPVPKFQIFGTCTEKAFFRTLPK